MVVVQQIGDALQHDRGLTGARDAVDQHDGDVRMANHLVLLALDGRGDSLQLLGMVLAQGV